MRIPLNNIFCFILKNCQKHNIDETHGIRHSMECFQYAQNIYHEERMKMPQIEKKEHIIYTSSLLHDMCDHKYFDNDDEGVKIVSDFLMINNYPSHDVCEIMKIVNTMSYSKVKQKGFPTFKNALEDKSYHIVREADLLCAYDVDRCILYDMYNRKNTFDYSLNRSIDLFNVRMFRHYDDGLFTTSYAFREGKHLEDKARARIEEHLHASKWAKKGP